MTSPSACSPKKQKNTRASSSRHAVTPAGATSSAAQVSTPKASHPRQASGKPSTRGKRRRPDTKDFPLRFPRLDRNSVPPPGRRDVASEAMTPCGMAGGDEGHAKASGVLRPLTSCAAAASIVASPVSAAHLLDLFFGAGASPQMPATGTSIPVPPDHARDDTHGTRCALFEELSPLGMPADECHRESPTSGPQAADQDKPAAAHRRNLTLRSARCPQPPSLRQATASPLPGVPSTRRISSPQVHVPETPPSTAHATHSRRTGATITPHEESIERTPNAVDAIGPGSQLDSCGKSDADPKRAVPACGMRFPDCQASSTEQDRVGPQGARSEPSAQSASPPPCVQLASSAMEGVATAGEKRSSTSEGWRDVNHVDAELSGDVAAIARGDVVAGATKSGSPIANEARVATEPKADANITAQVERAHSTADGREDVMETPPPNELLSSPERRPPGSFPHAECVPGDMTAALSSAVSVAESLDGLVSASTINARTKEAVGTLDLRSAADAGSPLRATADRDAPAKEFCTEQSTPARPRQLADTFECAEPSASGREDDTADAGPATPFRPDDEGDSQTPPSGPGFDYSPAGWGSSPGEDGRRENGTTVAALLKSRRDIRLQTPTSLDGPAKLTATTEPRGVSAAKNAPLRHTTIAPVPNPYAVKMGTLSTPRTKPRANPRKLPASPFAATAAAVARRRAAAEASSGEKAAEGKPTRADMRGSRITPASTSRPFGPKLRLDANGLGVGGSREGLSRGSLTVGLRTRSPSNSNANASATLATERPGGSKNGRPEHVDQGSDWGASTAQVQMPASTSSGFQTARGRALTVTAEAMSKVEHIFREETTGSNASSSKRSPPQGTDNRDDLQREKRSRVEEDRMEVKAHLGVPAVGARETNATSSNGGRASFQTGLGRAITVSDDALARVQHLFNEADDVASVKSALKSKPQEEAVQREEHPSSRRLSAESDPTTRPRDLRNRPVAESRHGRALSSRSKGFKHPARVIDSGTGAQEGASVHGAGRGAGRLESGIPRDTSAAFDGASFHTAGGRQLHASEEVMARVRHLFEEPVDRSQPLAHAKGVRRSTRARRDASTPDAGTTPSNPTGEVCRAPIRECLGSTSQSPSALQPAGGADIHQSEIDSDRSKSCSFEAQGSAHVRTSLNSSSVSTARDAQAPSSTAGLKDVPSLAPAKSSSTSADTSGGVIGDTGDERGEGKTTIVSETGRINASPREQNEADGGVEDNLHVAIASTESALDCVADGKPGARPRLGTGSLCRPHSAAGPEEYVIDAHRTGSSGTARGGRAPDTTQLVPNDNGSMFGCIGKYRGQDMSDTRKAFPSLSDVAKKGMAPEGGGFQTARGRAVLVSPEALARVQHLFSDENALEEGLASGSAMHANLETHVKRPARRVDGKAQLFTRKFSSLDGDPVKIARVGGAGGPRSRQSRIDADADHELSDEVPPPRTAGGTSSLCEGYDGRQCDSAAASAAEGSPRDFVATGFKTGGGRVVNVSAAAVIKSKAFFSDASDDVSRSRVDATVAPPTAMDNLASRVVNGTKHQRPGSSLLDGVSSVRSGLLVQQARQADSGDEATGISTTSHGSASGFRTARGQPVRVSSEALEQAEKFFANGENAAEHGVAPSITRSTRSGVGPETGNETVFASTHAEGDKNGRESGKASVVDRSDARSQSFFSSGTGRPITVSAEALARAQKIFGEDKQHLDEEPPRALASGIPKHGSANVSRSDHGISNSVSTRTTVRALHLSPEAQDVTRDVSAAGGSEKASGFRTASGKAVDVSAEALARAEKLFGNMDATAEPEGVADGGGTIHRAVLNSSAPAGAPQAPTSPAGAFLDAEAGRVSHRVAHGGKDGGASSEIASSYTDIVRDTGPPSGKTDDERRPRVTDASASSKDAMDKENGNIGPWQQSVKTPTRAVGLQARGVGSGNRQGGYRSTPRSRNPVTPSANTCQTGKQMLPPVTTTPRSSLSRRPTLASPNVTPSTIASGGTPLTMKRRGLGVGLGGRGLHGAKRPRSAVVAARASPPVSRIGGLHSGGHGASPATTGYVAASPRSAISMVRTAVPAHGSECTVQETRSPTAVGDANLSPARKQDLSRRELFGATSPPVRRGRVKSRRPLSSLLNRLWSPTTASAEGASGAGDKSDGEPEGVVTGAAEAVIAPGCTTDADGAVLRRNTTEAIETSNFKERRVPLRLNALLQRVTSTNACHVTFDADGRPSCIAEREKVLCTGEGVDAAEKGCYTGQETSAALFRKRLLQAGKDGGLASQTWVENHVRYDVELDRAKKPAIRAVLQGDASAARAMVLCVSRVYTPEELGDRCGPSAAGVIEVTDGWYPMDASLDGALAHFLRTEKIFPGLKLALSNAVVEAGVDPSGYPEGGEPESSGATVRGTGVDPLDLLRKRASGMLPPGAGPRLRLSVNSTRRARWDARLGFLSAREPRKGTERRALEVPLCTVVPGGGLVAATRAIVLRRYPALYVSDDDGGRIEDFPGGKGGASNGGWGRRRRVLSEVEEEGERELHQTKLQRALETESADVEEEVMAELEASERKSLGRLQEASGAETNECSAEEQEQVSKWRDHRQQVMEELRQKILEERLRGMNGAERRVRQLITLRVACTCRHADAGESDRNQANDIRATSGGGRRLALQPMVAVLKVWAPNEATAALLIEGAELRLHSASVSKVRHHMPGCSLELSTGRNTKIELLRGPDWGPSASDLSSAQEGHKVSPHDSAPDELLAVQKALVPRRYTPFLAWEGEAGLGSMPRTAFGSPSHGQAPGSGEEVDVVGCVFGVTRECPMIGEMLVPTAGPGEDILFGKIDGHDSGQAHPPVGGRGKQVAQPSDDKLGGGDARGASVTYRVYFVDASGACACLEKQIVPELVRHHRILRGATGSCWLVMNAFRRSAGPASFNVDSRGSATREASVATAIGAHELRWSSATVLGGSKGAQPPRTLGGAPAGHLAQPLIALRCWVEEGQGKSAVHYRREELALLLARQRRTRRREQAANNAAGLAVTRHENCRRAEAPGSGHVDARQDETQHTVLGFVVAFRMIAAQVEGSRVVCVRVDDGERSYDFPLASGALSQLLTITLGDNVCDPPLPSSADGSVPCHGGVTQASDEAGVPPAPSLSGVGRLFDRAKAVFRSGPTRLAKGARGDQEEPARAAVALEQTLLPDRYRPGEESVSHSETHERRTTLPGEVAGTPAGSGRAVEMECREHGKTVNELQALIMAVTRCGSSDRSMDSEILPGGNKGATTCIYKGNDDRTGLPPGSQDAQQEFMCELAAMCSREQLSFRLGRLENGEQIIDDVSNVDIAGTATELLVDLLASSTRTTVMCEGRHLRRKNESYGDYYHTLLHLKDVTLAFVQDYFTATSFIRGHL